MKLFTPRPWQPQAIEFLMSHPRCNLWMDMGLGKTVSALIALDGLEAVGDSPWPALVLGPKRVARDVWPTEPRKWDQLSALHVEPIMGKQELRRLALRRSSKIFSINYDLLPWLCQYLGDAWPFKTVVADEATRLKGFRLNSGGVRAEALGRVAHRHVNRWINLTGTPAPKGLEDLWGQCWFLDRGERLGRTHTAFKQRWFQRSWDGYGTEPMPHSDTEIHERIRDITLTIEAKDWFDVKEPLEVPVYVDLPSAVRAQYKRLEKELFTELLGGQKIEVFNSAALTNKLLQMASGAAYTTHPAWAPVHDEKLEALASIYEEANGSPLLVAYEFQSERHRILEKFKRAVDISTKAGWDKFMSGKSDMGVAHPGSMGHGVDGLQNVCHKMVRFGFTWNGEFWRQILGRIGPVRQMQSGFDRIVNVYNIVARDTLDEDVIARHVLKLTVEDALRAAMKRRM